MYLRKKLLIRQITIRNKSKFVFLPFLKRLETTNKLDFSNQI